MLRFIGKRLLWMIPVLLGVSIFIFTILYFTPGDPVRTMLGPMASQEDVEHVREELGLNDPFLVQYLNFMKEIVLHGNLGKSFSTGESIISSISIRIPYTIRVALISMFVSVLIGIPLGMVAALHQNSWLDNLSMFLSMFFVSIPSFWIALELVIFFSLRLHILPAMGVETWKAYIMPCVSMGLGGMAGIARQTRSSMLEVLGQDYVVTARSKGLSNRDVIWKHVFKNAMIPIITTVGGSFASMLGGSLIAETVFAIPGMGVYLMTAISNRDYPVIRGSALILSVWFSLCILIVDIIYAFVDPRIKQQYTGK
ncbi:MAG: ABC transporter permease [Blautia sp.]|nr:ABC transporter permease [Blautia sp.]